MTQRGVDYHTQVKRAESYSVTIKLTHVRDVGDLMLQLVRILSWFEPFHDNPLNRLGVLSQRKTQPVPLSYKGIKRYGQIEVRADNGTV